MNAKNLPLKFAFVALLVLVSLWSVFRGNGLRLGIDLRGGHSLIYGIMDNDAEIKKIQDRQTKLRADLAKATEKGIRKEIRETIERNEADIKRLKAGGDQGNLAERMIAILKNRVDPQGLMNLEWRPLGTTRFEVRMPAGKADTTEARQAYQRALSVLTKNNVDNHEIRRIERAAPDQRAAEIRKLAGGNRDLAGRLEALAKAYDERNEALAGADDAARTRALVAYADRRDAVRKYNISPAALGAVLRNYVSPAEANLKDMDAEELDNRREAYKNGLKDLRAKHAGRGGEIKEVDAKYREWANKRRRLEDPSDLKRLIAKAGMLEFRIAPLNVGGKDSPFRSAEEVNGYIKTLGTPGGPEEMRADNKPFLWHPIRGDENSFDNLVTGPDDTGKPHVLLYNTPRDTMRNQGPGGWRLSRAYQTSDSRGLPAVGFEFDELGAKEFARLTSEHKGWRMAILLDDEAYSAPIIKEVISRTGIIEMGGRVKEDEVKDLVRTLEAGALPGKLLPEPLSENTFGPAIGERNRDLGIRAAWIAMIGVAVFMLIYYLKAGTIADVALVLNIILVLGAMSLLNAVFTLPGIAGVILTIGIAVDANVLIFERLREEQAKGQTVRMALKNAYDRAFTAIIDANVTTLITCLILGWIGTEEVRGFAITLGLGVAFSLFTALVLTRWVFQILLDNSVVKKPVFMLSIIGVPKINWMGKRYIFWAVSGLMIVMGIASLAWQGKRIWGIEFSAGTKATFQFRDDALLDGRLPDDKLVRDLFTVKALAGKHDMLAATARVETLPDPEQAQGILDRRDTNRDGKVTRAEWKAQGLKEASFDLLDTRKDDALELDELEKMGPLTYQLSTTENSVPIIRTVAAEAFGDAQQRRSKCTFRLIQRGWGKCDFTLVKDASRTVLGLGISPTGQTPIKAVAGTPESDLLKEYEGGVMFVIRDVQPALSRARLEDRIGSLRSQTLLPEGLRGLARNKTAVRLLPAAAGTPPELAVLVQPKDKPANWDEFAAKEARLLAAALEKHGETGKVLGQELDRDGHIKIKAVASLDDSDLLEEYEDGVMFVIRDVYPAINETDLLERIKIMRFQSDLYEDLRGLTHNETQVRLLGTDSAGRPAFAVLVRPLETPTKWSDFAAKEAKLLTAALYREEALVASNFDAAIAGETAQRAIIAVVLSWVAIVGYLWLRFGSIQWGLAAVICLIHDVIIVVGLVAVTGWLHDTFLGRALGLASFKIDLAMVAAVMTVIGYSVNDTIVVFDRIRENRGKLTTVSSSVINTSINQTLARTLLTSGTTFIVVFIMYVWGGSGIRPFNYALLAGILFGTYSSVAVASPLLLGFKKAFVARTAGAEPATD